MLIILWFASHSRMWYRWHYVYCLLFSFAEIWRSVIAQETIYSKARSIIEWLGGLTISCIASTCGSNMELSKSTKGSIWSWQVRYIVPVWLAGNSFKCGHCQGCTKVSPVQARRGWGCHSTLIVIYGLTFPCKLHSNLMLLLPRAVHFSRSLLAFLQHYILFMSSDCPSALINSCNWWGWVRGSSWVRMLLKVWATPNYSYIWAICFFHLCWFYLLHPGEHCHKIHFMKQSSRKIEIRFLFAAKV